VWRIESARIIAALGTNRPDVGLAEELAQTLWLPRSNNARLRRTRQSWRMG